MSHNTFLYESIVNLIGKHKEYMWTKITFLKQQKHKSDWNYVIQKLIRSYNNEFETFVVHVVFEVDLTHGKYYVGEWLRPVGGKNMIRFENNLAAASFEFKGIYFSVSIMSMCAGIIEKTTWNI